MHVRVLEIFAIGEYNKHHPIAKDRVDKVIIKVGGVQYPAQCSETCLTRSPMGHKFLTLLSRWARWLH